MVTVDLNCDMGEGFGPWTMGNDAQIIKFISSANIACGFHAGDPSTMRRTVELALEHGVAIGAHPGYPDLQGFGRREMKIDSTEVRDMLVYQIAAMKGICEAAGAKLNHVKPHGALYNQACVDMDLAKAVAASVVSLDPNLILYGLAGSCIITAGESHGLQTASEVFADRTYQANGNLTPRSFGNALVRDTAKAVEQAAGMIENGRVIAVDGTNVSVKADTICVHGDGEKAPEFAEALSTELRARGIEIAALIPK